MRKSNFINDLEEEFSQKNNENLYEKHTYFDKEERDRIRFEEEHFVRLPVKKKDKIRIKKKQKAAREEKIDDFGEIENIREILKIDGMIEDTGKTKEKARKMAKTLKGVKGKIKTIKKFNKKMK